MHLDQPFKLAPRNPLQQIVEHAIVMPHGVAPVRVQVTRQRPEPELNQHRAPCPPFLNRTPVG
ncbi:hypothetical protein KXS07_37365, partial [Inquilinus limosus]|uniref:hypothetical protein n=1 Tax=Inquilinus limosus TaxID=171674 RepID=UPI003F16135A